ncbi:MAG: acetate--CoA ligase family protein [Christensenellaceae bacterium]|jgi:acetyl-CoA synthetase (ADP-forming)|nr:acetate--CoA ligase family protein [Christensenellaceae bacterium]
MNEWIGTALTQKRDLLEPEAWALLAAYGIPVPKHRLVKTAAEAVAAAGAIGYPVVLKVVSQDILHKSDAGGVRVGLRDAEAVQAAYAGILKSVRAYQPNARVEGIFVCEMLPPGGVECIIGTTHDASFGPVVMVGLGGIFVEVLRDVSFRIPPLNKADALAMIGELKGAALLTGIRGQKPRDVEALADMLLRVARLVQENPEIEELDINPCIVYEAGAVPVDARVLLKSVF